MKKYLISSAMGFLALTAVASAQNYVFNTDLTLGSRGQDVINLQSWLISNGFDIQAVSLGVTPKGYFGTQTKAALMAYQRSVGLPAFGFFGPLTRAKLNTRAQTVGPLTVISPNGGESWQRGSTKTIAWNAPQFFKAAWVQINLVPYYQPCTGQVCPMSSQSSTLTSYMYRAPYTIAQNVSIDQHAYSWNVGQVSGVSGNTGIASPMAIPDGQYVVQICETEGSVCDSSDQPFSIYSGTSNTAPVISGIDAPTSLAVNQTGTWTVHAIDPQNGTLSYSVVWGDEPVYTYGTVQSAPSAQFTQGTTFTHAYAGLGTRTIVFTVRNSAGLTVQTSTTVQVHY